MKKNLTLSSFALFLLLITIFSCKKKDSEITPATLNGTWELRSISGSQIAGDPNYSPGNGNIFVFSDGNFKSYIKSKPLDSGTYTVQKEDLAINNNKANYSILLNNKTKFYIKIAQRTLIVFDGVIAADGYEATYEKQNLAQ